MSMQLTNPDCSLLWAVLIGLQNAESAAQAIVKALKDEICNNFANLSLHEFEDLQKKYIQASNALQDIESRIRSDQSHYQSLCDKSSLK